MIYAQTTPPGENASKYRRLEQPGLDYHAQNPLISDAQRVQIQDSVWLLQAEVEERMFEAPVQIEGSAVKVTRGRNTPALQIQHNQIEGDQIEGDPAILQAFATLTRAHQMHERALGHPIRYQTEDGKLSVQMDVPVLGTGASRGTLHFAESASDISLQDPDIAAHEQGHLILESIRPQYKRDKKPGTGALHEGFADATAVLVALQDPGLRAKVLEGWSRGESSNVVSRLAEGQAAPYDEALRDLSQLPAQRDESSPHAMSRPFSHGFYQSLQAIYRDESQTRPPQEALVQTTEIMLQLLDRSLEFLPLGDGARVEDLVGAMVGVDHRVYQGRHTQRLLENFAQVGIQPTPTSLSHPDLAGDYRLPAEPSKQDLNQLEQSLRRDLPGAQLGQVSGNRYGETFVHFQESGHQGLLVCDNQGTLIHWDTTTT